MYHYSEKLGRFTKCSASSPEKCRAGGKSLIHVKSAEEAIGLQDKINEIENFISANKTFSHFHNGSLDIKSENELKVLEISGLKTSRNLSDLLKTYESLSFRPKNKFLENNKNLTEKVLVRLDKISNKELKENFKDTFGNMGEELKDLKNDFQKFEDYLNENVLNTENGKKQLIKFLEIEDKPTVKIGDDEYVIDIPSERELLQDSKQLIREYMEVEFGETLDCDEFEEKYPDITKIPLGYSDTPDENHTIQMNINLEDMSYTQYVNNVPITHYSYLDTADGDRRKALQYLNIEIQNGSYEDWVRVDEKDLYNKMKLLIDDEGNFY